MRKPFMQDEVAQAKVAVLLLIITGILYAGMLWNEHRLDEELRAAGIDIMQMVREAR